MFALDIRGHLNSLRLAESKALWPLFEAVVNSIQSIEDSPNRDNGKITIFAQREDQDPNLTIQKDVLERFESFVIEDNGNGMNTANYRSFNTAYSTLKIQKGCKGIGRFLWLKAFETVEIESVFQEDGQYYRRKFSFNPDGVSPENNLVEIDEDNIKTIVRLNNFATQYRHAAPVELPVIAKRIIEHCLPFFISGHCPQIIIRDGVTDTIDLNQYFESNIRDSLHQDRFQLQGSDYVIYHLRLPEGTSQHELHLCANMQEVTSVDLKRFIPDLQKRIVPIDNPTGFFYVGYVTSSYLDSIVNTTRTGFDFDETGNQVSLFGTGKDSVVSASIDYIIGYLADYLEDVKKKKRKQIDDFVSQDRPAYRYLLHNRPNVYDLIPAGLKKTHWNWNCTSISKTGSMKSKNKERI